MRFQLSEIAEGEEPPPDLGQECGLVLRPEVWRGEPWVGQEVRPVHHGAVTVEERCVHRAGHDGDAPTVGQVEDRRLGGAQGVGFAGPVEVGQHRMEPLVHRQEGGRHRDVDVLAHARGTPLMQARQHGDGRFHARVDIGMGREIVAGGVAVQTEMAEQSVGETGLGLHRRGVARPRLPRPGLPVPADRHVDHRRVDLGHGGVVQAEGRQRPGTEILDDHVRSAAQVQHQRPSGRVVEIDRHVALPGVLLRVVVRDAVRSRGGDASEITGGRLDLDHVGTEVPQNLGAVRPGENPTEVHDLHAVERLGNGRRIEHRHAPRKMAPGLPVSRNRRRPASRSALAHTDGATSSVSASPAVTPAAAVRLAMRFTARYATVGPAAS